MSEAQRFYEAPASGDRRSAPAALRNREHITEVLREWLPRQGLVLELASGTGEHVVHFARAFPDLQWQPSDIDGQALASIQAWRCESELTNIHQPIAIDASAREWPVEGVDAILSINMVHISPWDSALGLLDGAGRLLPAGGPLILYGPWLTDGIETAPSNLAFDADLRRRNPQWGLRKVEEFEGEAEKRGLWLVDQRAMPANNRMLCFRKQDPTKPGAS